jgi:basic membrane protein A
MHRLRIGALFFGAANAGSFVAAGERGLRRAAAEHAFDLDAVHCVDLALEARIAALDRLAASGPDLVVVHGGQGDPVVAQLAPRRPGVRFAISQGGHTAANVASYDVRMEEAVFLAGAAAGALSRAQIVGHLSGERVRPGLQARAAFAAGLARAGRRTRLLTSFCGSQHDAARAAFYARSQAAHGADLIFTMLGAGRDGVTAVCRELGLRQIGDGIDWCTTDPTVFAAAAVGDVAWCTYQAVSDLACDRFETGVHKSVGLERPDLCRLALAAEVPAEVRRRVEDLAAAIAAGREPIAADWTGEEFEAGESAAR